MHRVEHIMGMPIIVEVRDGDVPEDVFDWFRRVDETFSTFKDGSEVSRIQRHELAVDEASAEVRRVYARCAELRDETSGFFDVDAVGLDPSGYVKGWAVDAAAGILDRAGSEEYAINAGGDVRTRGRWRIGIQHPLEPQAVSHVLEADDLAVATSGAYERGAHVRDPHSAHPPAGILSVTITGPELGTADAYATAAFAMGGRRAPNWIARLEGYEAMTILSDGRVLSTPGFPSSD
ncbi:MAG: FAD:protein FMN transferase [Acidobacteriota bacterium]|nr:FAD:protein FMN transferase [Acidobacteriota bacterium]